MLFHPSAEGQSIFIFAVDNPLTAIIISRARRHRQQTFRSNVGSRGSFKGRIRSVHFGPRGSSLREDAGGFSTFLVADAAGRRRFFITSLNNPRGLNLGFDPNHLLLITIDPSLVGYREPKLNKRVRAIAAAHSRSPGVLSATMSSHGLVTPGADDSGFSLCK